MKRESLADYLGLDDPTANDHEVVPAARPEDITDPKEFAIAVLSSRDFRLYVVNSLTLGSIPSAVVLRLMDYGWGKPPERIEHTGKDGDAIITEVRRTIVRAAPNFMEMVAEADAQEQKSKVTH